MAEAFAGIVMTESSGTTEFSAPTEVSCLSAKVSMQHCANGALALSISPVFETCRGYDLLRCIGFMSCTIYDGMRAG